MAGISIAVPGVSEQPCWAVAIRFPLKSGCRAGCTSSLSRSRSRRLCPPLPCRSLPPYHQPLRTLLLACSNSPREPHLPFIPPSPHHPITLPARLRPPIVRLLPRPPLRGRVSPLSTAQRLPRWLHRATD